MKRDEFTTWLFKMLTAGFITRAQAVSALTRYIEENPE